MENTGSYPSSNDSIDINLQGEFDNLEQEFDNMSNKHYLDSVKSLYSIIQNLSDSSYSLSYKEEDLTNTTLEVKKGLVGENSSLLSNLYIPKGAINYIDNELNDDITFTLKSDRKGFNDIDIVVNSNGDFYINGKKLNDEGKDRVLSKLNSEIDQFKLYDEFIDNRDSELELAKLDNI